MVFKKGEINNPLGRPRTKPPKARVADLDRSINKLTAEVAQLCESIAVLMERVDPESRENRRENRREED